MVVLKKAVQTLEARLASEEYVITIIIIFKHCGYGQMVVLKKAVQTFEARLASEEYVIIIIIIIIIIMIIIIFKHCGYVQMVVLKKAVQTLEARLASEEYVKIIIIIIIFKHYGYVQMVVLKKAVQTLEARLASEESVHLLKVGRLEEETGRQRERRQLTSQRAGQQIQEHESAVQQYLGEMTQQQRQLEAVPKLQWRISQLEGDQVAIYKFGSLFKIRWISIVN
jgi:hypothetical protein